MISQQAKRIQQVVKYERRVLDDLRSALNEQTFRLDTLRNQIESTQQRIQIALAPSGVTDEHLNTIGAIQQYTNRMDASLNELRSEWSTQQTNVDNARSAVIEQKARVKAIETLCQRLNQQAVRQQLQAEHNELTDAIINQFLEKSS